MNKMEDREVRRMAVFKLRQVERQLTELEACTDDAGTRVCLAGVRAALHAASNDLQSAPLRVIVEGDDETHLAVG